MLFPLLALGGCGRSLDGPEFEVDWVSAKLRAAGYEVSAPAADRWWAGIPEVVHGECLEATKEGKVDELCIIHCTSRSSCRAGLITRSPLGESGMGTMDRGSTVLVHRRCGYRDCGAARDAIFDRKVAR